jgi:Skp family chaperone for outer membrane proteins
MKRSFALIPMLVSGFALSAAAQTLPAPSAAAPAGPAKIAVIAFQVAVAQTNEGQRNFAELQKKYAPKEAELKAASEEIETLTKQLQAQADKLNDADKASKAKIIDDKKKAAEPRAVRSRVHQHHEGDNRCLQREVGRARASCRTGSSQTSGSQAGSRTLRLEQLKCFRRLPKPRSAGLWISGTLI